ncbi:MAG: hypothetical protein Q8928_07295 [Bacteroidota bacterium]|nr:hypothetical protein [Bacteroidota bacterium]
MENTFYKVGRWAVFVGGGSDCPVYNNLFADCNIAIHVDNRLANWESSRLKPNDLFDRKLKAVKYDQPPYSIRYPEIVNYWEEMPQIPKRNQVSKNIFYNVNKPIEGNKECFPFCENNWITSQLPGFKSLDKKDFTKIDYKKILRYIEGFEKFPFDKMGRK